MGEKYLGKNKMREVLRQPQMENDREIIVKVDKEWRVSLEIHEGDWKLDLALSPQEAFVLGDWLCSAGVTAREHDEDSVQ